MEREKGMMLAIFLIIADVVLAMVLIEDVSRDTSSTINTAAVVLGKSTPANILHIYFLLYYYYIQ